MYITIKYIVLLVFSHAIINYTNEDIKKEVLENIEKSLKYNKNNYDDIKEGDKILINQFVHHSGKKLVFGIFKKKNTIFKIPGTILLYYGSCFLYISIDIDTFQFNKGDEYIIESKLCTLISKDNCDKILSESSSIKSSKKENKKKRKNS